MNLEQAKQLQADIMAAAERLHIDALSEELATLQQESQAADFWQDNLHAQDVMRQIAKLEARVAPWQELIRNITDDIELLNAADASMEAELFAQISDIADKFTELKEQLKFTGPYDDHDAILSIHAGAGGADAQDWAQMLLRMYIRWAESGPRGQTHRGVGSSGAPPSYAKYDSVRSSAPPSAAPTHPGHEYSVKLIEEMPGEEGGIKSATLEISGPYAYGRLKGEHGVHRLVRLSPFNAESRETSFAKVEITPKIDKPDELVIDDKDLKIDVYRSGGHGGQSVNTTDSAVRVTHLPTGIVVAIQNERSQLQNKETAMTILRSKLAQLQLEQHAEKVSDLKGPDSANEFGSQIRNYVLHPYKQVKDLRSGYETSDPDAVLNGDLDDLIDAYLEYSLGIG